MPYYQHPVCFSDISPHAGLAIERRLHTDFHAHAHSRQCNCDFELLDPTPDKYLHVKYPAGLSQ